MKLEIETSQCREKQKEEEERRDCTHTKTFQLSSEEHEMSFQSCVTAWTVKIETQFFHAEADYAL